MKNNYFKEIFFSTIFLAGYSCMGFAQGEFINNGAKIHVEAGTNLIIGNNGSGTVNFVNESGGSVENDGTISVNGNWENNDNGGVFSTSAGTVNLNGTTAQTILGTQKTDFNNLNLTNSQKTLNVNAQIDNVIDITSTELDLNSNTLFVENSSPSAVTTSTGYILSETPPSSGYGMLDWNIGNITGTYTIPFATASLTPLTFTYDINNVGSGGSMGRVAFATYPTDNNNVNSEWPTGVNHVTDDFGQDNWQFVMDRYWIIDNDMQAAGYSDPNFPAIDYIFKYDDADHSNGNNIIDEDLMVLQRYNDDTDTWLDWLYSGYVSVNGNTTTNTMTINLTNKLDYYDVWTFVDQANPLPIELVKFNANCGGGIVNVTWTTASETNNDYFTIERSQDGYFFEEVTTVDGAGNSNSINTYSIVDENPYDVPSYGFSSTIE